MAYKHIDILPVQTPKKPGALCGDVYGSIRTESATVLVVSDGIGSGSSAHIAASMCVSRMLEYVRNGVSLRTGCYRVANTMNRARGTDNPYAVFTVLRILNDGSATVISYEMPPAVLVGRNHASVLNQRIMQEGGEIISESSCYLREGEGILVFSDGVSQAGMGTFFTLGWESEGVSRFVTDRLAEGTSVSDLSRLVHAEARRYWGNSRGDDCTAVGAVCRKGVTVNIFTGPPASKDSDYSVVQEFMRSEGIKVVAGATTAKIVARHLRREVVINCGEHTAIAPPVSFIEDIDLVTEGAVTLTQAYNVYNESTNRLEKNSGVSDLCMLLKTADRVNFMVGVAANPANESINFRQLGILGRTSIVKLLSEKLEADGKLVVVRMV